MSATTYSGSKKALFLSTGCSALGIAAMTGMKVLRQGRLLSPLGIAGFILPLLSEENGLLRRLLVAATKRITKRLRSGAGAGVCNENNHTDL